MPYLNSIRKLFLPLSPGKVAQNICWEYLDQVRLQIEKCIKSGVEFMYYASVHPPFSLWKRCIP